MTSRGDNLTTGDLQWRITIQRARKGVDAFNNPTVNWYKLATVWASWDDVSDSERIAAAGTEAEVTTRFQIRFSSDVSDVNPKDRITFRGLTYDINNVKMIGRNVGLEISAHARTDL